MITATLRKTSDNDNFPWKSKRVPFILIDFKQGIIEEAQTENDKMIFVDRAMGDETESIVIIAAWPGEWRQDIFLVDNLDIALSGVGRYNGK